MSERKNYAPIYIVSGGKGLAGNAVVQSVLIQFPNNPVPVIIEPDVLTEKKISDAVIKAANSGGVIVHTMVDPENRDFLIRECENKNVNHFDLVGNLSDHISNLLNKQPISKPGLYRLRNIQYYERIKAIEYTMKHDDGQNVDKIKNADIVLTGVSRSGKTPLSVYLAMFGWKVANVPLVIGITPPQQLFEVDPKRVFGLNISVNYLIAQRSYRVQSLRMSKEDDYISPRRVRQELDYATGIFKKGGFTVMNITNKPIESSANDILTLLTSRFDSDNWKMKNNIEL